MPALNITPVAALSDNYIWIVGQGRQALCIDPGEAAPVLAYLAQYNLELIQIWITHHHHDHTDGITELKQAYPQCVVYGNVDIGGADKYVCEGSKLKFGGYWAEVWATPGHTDTHLSYLLHGSESLHVFCGDTLFSAGCGRVFSGTAAQLAASLQRYKRLPENTLFYPAHEYTAENLRFAAYIEPDNPHIMAARTAAAYLPTLPVDLAHELKINPFLRTSKSQVAVRAAELGGAYTTDETAVFIVLRTLKNRF